MNQAEKYCIISIFRTLYADGGKKEKGKILDGVCERVKVGRRGGKPGGCWRRCRPEGRLHALESCLKSRVNSFEPAPDT
jgi:hypothetical protein